MILPNYISKDTASLFPELILSIVSMLIIVSLVSWKIKLGIFIDYSYINEKAVNGKQKSNSIENDQEK